MMKEALLVCLLQTATTDPKRKFLRSEKMGMMMKEALLVCLLQTAALSKHIYQFLTPTDGMSPLLLSYQELTMSTVDFFNAILLIERDNTKEHLTDAYIKYRDHFEYE